MIKEVACYNLNGNMAKHVAWKLLSLKLELDEDAPEYSLGLGNHTHKTKDYVRNCRYKEKYFCGFVCYINLNLDFYDSDFYEMHFNRNRRKELYKPANYTLNRFYKSKIRVFNGFFAPFQPTKNFKLNFRLEERFEPYFISLKKNHQLLFNYELSEIEISYGDLQVYGDFFRVSVLLDLIDWVDARKNKKKRSKNSTKIAKMIHKTYFEPQKSMNMCRKAYAFEDILEDLLDFKIIDIKQVTKDELNEKKIKENMKKTLLDLKYSESF